MGPPSTSEFSNGGTCCLQMLIHDICVISTATELYTRVPPTAELIDSDGSGLFYLPIQDTMSASAYMPTGYGIP